MHPATRSVDRSMVDRSLALDPSVFQATAAEQEWLLGGARGGDSEGGEGLRWEAGDSADPPTTTAAEATQESLTGDPSSFLNPLFGAAKSPGHGLGARGGAGGAGEGGAQRRLALDAVPSESTAAADTPSVLILEVQRENARLRAELADALQRLQVQHTDAEAPRPSTPSEAALAQAVGRLQEDVSVRDLEIDLLRSMISEMSHKSEDGAAEGEEADRPATTTTPLSAAAAALLLGSPEEDDVVASGSPRRRPAAPTAAAGGIEDAADLILDLETEAQGLRSALREREVRVSDLTEQLACVQREAAPTQMRREVRWAGG